MNKVLLCKWLWRFGIEEDSIWRRIMASKYGVVGIGKPRQIRGTIEISPW